MRISDWSSDVCSSDLAPVYALPRPRRKARSAANAETCVRPEAGPAPEVEGRHSRPCQAERRRRSPGHGQRDRVAIRRGSLRPPLLRIRLARYGSPNLDITEEHTSELQSPMRISYAV